MIAYLEPRAWSEFHEWLNDLVRADPRPATAFLERAPNTGTGPSSMLNCEMNLRTFAAKQYADAPGWRPEWAPNR